MDHSDRNSDQLSDPATVGELVAQAIAHWRSKRQWSQAELAERMRAIGVPWHRTAVTKIESGDRAVTAEELVAVAFVLGVSPTVLYTPRDTRPMKIAPHVTTDGGLVYRWACGDNWPTLDVDALRFYDEAAPSYEYAAERLVPGLQALRRAVSLAIGAAGVHPGYESMLADNGAPATSDRERLRLTQFQLTRVRDAAHDLRKAVDRAIAELDDAIPPLG